MTVDFDAVQRPAAMLAEAVLGRPVRVEVDDAARFDGGRLDGAAPADASGAVTIVLPSEVALFDDAELDRRTFRHAVLHQAGYELFGTAAFDVARFLADHPERPALAEWFAVIEDARVDAALVERFPGAARDAGRVRAAIRHGEAQQAVLDVLSGRPDLSRWTAEDAAALALALCPAATIAATGVGEAGRAVRVAAPEGDGAPDEADADDESADVQLLVATTLAFAADVDDVRGVDDDAASSGASLPDDAPRRGPSAGRREVEVRHGASPTGAATAAAGPVSVRYDEWDCHAGRYLPAWCRVTERSLPGGDPGFVVDVRRRHAALLRQVRRQFGMIAPESWRRVHRERDGGELDLDEVVTSLVDRRSGIVDDEHLHVRQERAEREVAAAFLLDMSASTSTPVPDPDEPEATPLQEPDFLVYRSMPFDDEDWPPPPSRTVLDLAKESLALMCDALHVLGDDHAIYGFSGEGRDDVEFYVAKELGERTSARTWARLDAMRPRRYTRMGPAIRHATWKLRHHQARTRVLVLVSDGYPQDRDYGPSRTDKAYGIADTAKALDEAERAGVVPFCITVDPAGHDYLRRMLPADRYVVIDDVRSLPGELTKLYRTIALTRR